MRIPPNQASRGAPRRQMAAAALAVAAGLAVPPHASAATAADAVAALPPIEVLRQQFVEQARQLDALRERIASQQTALDALRRSLEPEAPTAAAPAPAAEPAAPAAAPRIAPIFEQPGVLTPQGHSVVEPSLQYSYSSSNRIALVGYTVIPAILVGVIDVREVKRSTWTAALAWRYGLSQRLEIEAKLPWVARHDTAIGREVLQGADGDAATPFDSGGKGQGDAEFTARYQFNDGAADKPYFVGGLRLKTRTGKDPFQVTTSSSVAGFRGEGVQTELPTGSGFYGLQPALTVLLPSDPAVFFGTVSYLHSVTRNNVVRNTDQGPEAIGSIAPGGIFGFNVGMGLALNEKASFSIGYDHGAVGKTRQNGQTAPGSVQLQLGTLLLGFSYRLDDRRTLNVALGAGLTRDTPDLTLTLRVPTSF